MSKLIYVFPSRSRPHKFFAAVENIINMAQHPNFEIHAALDTDDYTMYSPAVEEKIQTYPQLIPHWGRSTCKVNAINRAVSTGAWDVLVLHSDDMQIVQPGFDLQILKDIGENDDCVVHYKDGHAHDPILSWPVMTRKYYDRFGYIYHPSYQSLFCDEEAIIVAKRLGKLVESDAAIIVHNHPAWDRRFTADAQLIKTQKLHPIDKQVFIRRKQQNFFV